MERVSMEESSAQAKFQLLKVLWMAFVGTVAMYIVIAYMLGLEREPAADLSLMLPILSIAAAAMTLLAFLGHCAMGDGGVGGNFWLAASCTWRFKEYYSSVLCVVTPLIPAFASNT